MATGSLQQVLHRLRQSVLRLDEVSDGKLLQQFLDYRDQNSFTKLVQRHGMMVLGVCLRVLGNRDDAEDAFQATFLILVRKASSFRNRETVGNWLHGVAYHVALKARAAGIRRREQETKAMQTPSSPREESWQELQSLLDQELQALPEKYRTPVVLCDLEGMTQKEAAQKLGCPEGTLSGRLFRAKALLARRLSKHGPAVSGAVLAALLTKANAAAASLSPAVVSATVEAAAAMAGHVLGAAVVSSKVTALTDSVMRGMLLAKLKIAGTITASGTMIASVVVIAAIGSNEPATPVNSAIAPQALRVEDHRQRPDDALAEKPVVQPVIGGADENENREQQTGQHEDHKGGPGKRRQDGQQNGPDEER